MSRTETLHVSYRNGRIPLPLPTRCLWLQRIGYEIHLPVRLVANLSRYQLVKNKMEVYLIGTRPLHQDPGNLFALRCDLYLSQFDQGRFVIVPKSGQLVVHFVQPANQSAQRYHNIQFDHKNSLSHELLYARFAWALMKIVKNASLDAKMFNFRRASGESTPA